MSLEHLKTCGGLQTCIQPSPCYGRIIPSHMQRASRLPVSGPHHLHSGGNQRGWRDGRRVLTAAVQPTLSTDDTDWKFWFSSPADIAQRVDSQAQLWEDNSLFIRRCQESWGASRQWEPLADAAVGPQVHHSYWKWGVSTYIQLPGSHFNCCCCIFSQGTPPTPFFHTVIPLSFTWVY